MGFDLDIPEGERGLLLGGVLGPDNYAAGRYVVADLRQKGASSVLYYLGADTVDNETVVLCPILGSITVTTMTIGVLGVPYMPFYLTESQKLRVSGGSLANTETLSGLIYIATRILPPVSSAVGTGVTLTTNNINQV